VFQVSETPAQTWQADFIFGIAGQPVPTDQLTLHLYGNYTGNPGHNVKVKQWNFDSSSWNDVTSEVRDVPSEASEQSYKWGLLLNNTDGTYASSGEIRIRFDHETAGSAGHSFSIDLLSLEQGLPTTSASTTASTTATSTASTSRTSTGSTSASTSQSSTASTSATTFHLVEDYDVEPSIAQERGLYELKLIRYNSAILLAKRNFGIEFKEEPDGF
jgi:5-hydroxyisourate hydrolase-like protein (transthyretin family)